VRKGKTSKGFHVVDLRIDALEVKPLNADAWAAFMSAFPTAFPDAQISVDASVAERDIVVSRWTLTGTHRGEFQGVPPTGKAVTMVGIDFSRVVDGKIDEHWAQFDVIGVMQQIGAIPARKLS
jgi:steroid delta-isomerase-like uncharacterized protein